MNLLDLVKQLFAKPITSAPVPVTPPPDPNPVDFNLLIDKLRDLVPKYPRPKLDKKDERLA